MRNKKEKWLAFLLVFPSILAVAIFVYGFIGWTTGFLLAPGKE